MSEEKKAGKTVGGRALVGLLVAVLIISIISVILAGLTLRAVRGVTKATHEVSSAVKDVASAIATVGKSIEAIGKSLEKLGAATGELREAISTLEKRVGELEKRVAAPPPAKPAVTLIVVGPWAGKEMEAFLPVLREFEKRNPGIKVEYRIMRAEDLGKVLPAQFKAKTCIGDVIIMAWPWFVEKAAKEGHLLDLSDVVDPKDFLPGTCIVVGGRVYGAPVTGVLKPGFWYRKSVFAKHGLKPPKTYEEFKSLVAKLKEIYGPGKAIATGDGVGWPCSDITEHFLIYFGGKKLWDDLIAGKVDWTKDSRIRKAFTELASLLKAGYFSEPADWTIRLKEWWGGKFGIYFMGSWIIGMVDKPEDLGIIPLPDIEAVTGGADLVFVPKYTKHPEEAKRLAAWIVSAEGQKIHAIHSGRVPTNVKVPAEALPPATRALVEAIKGKAILPDLDDTIGGKFQRVFWDQLKRFWVHPEEMEDVLAKIQEAYAETVGGKG